MFLFDEEQAEKQFHYRTVMINWLYTPGITYKELAEESNDLWQQYLNYESVDGHGDKDPSESWSTWYAFGWWQESRHCEERINASNAALASLLSRLQTTLELCCDAATKAKSRTLPFEEALKDPHEELLHKMRGVKQVCG